MDEVFVANEQREVLAVKIDLSNGFRQGATRRLFRLGPSEGIAGSAPGNERFLLRTEIRGSAVSQLEIVLGWPQLIERQ